ncbi:MAG: hypothetical protein EPO51_13900 [Phenylobacterium sp.]|uniref:hypothetical protein n=1 Tax=Phenylobacterium sp. TaxID=1871053 RepID=UPI00121505DD|nr:hypothetical protein [Phenylobacterium sp.]TAJ71386.1 MAG: hypothetical protein EPO51_13900 [Phenylobacterium sp.]
MDENIAYLLELRLKLRGNREGLAIVDRCLRLIARAADADGDTLRALEAEVAALGDELALRFGAPGAISLH